MKKISLTLFVCFLFIGKISAQVVGIDVSANNPGFDFNLAASQSPQRTFAWIKATEGETGVEGLFSQNIAGARAAGMTIGMYHYGHPDNNNSAVAEANHFLNFALPYTGNNYLPPALDIETAVANKIEINALVTWIGQWMQTVEDKTHVVPILYISQSYTNRAEFKPLAKYLLWVADPDGSATAQPKPTVWDKWTFKQYTEDTSNPAYIGGKLVDMDSFYSNQAAFNALISTNPGITLYPDLAITGGTQKLSSSSAAAGSNIKVSCSEDNKGGAAAGANNVTIWLSADATLNTGSDTKLGSIAFPAVYANSNTLVNTTTVELPAGTPPGQYYVFFYADGDNQVSESDEINNFASQVITITGSQPLPDLQVLNAQISPGTVTPGQQVTVSCSNNNQGSGNASASYTSVWLSADQKFDGTPVDTYLGDIAVPALTAGQTSSTLSQNITIPNGPYAGTWYILFGADGTGVVNESVESNNQVFIPVTFGNSGPPVAPVLTLTPACNTTSGQITLNWTATATAASYDIYRNNALYQTGVSGTQYADVAVTPGQNYSYSVTARLPGSSLVSNTSNTDAPDCSVTSLPGTPVLTLIPDCNGTSPFVTLRWTSSPGAISYGIYRNNTLYTTVSGVNTFTDQSVTASANYFYYVRAINSAGGSNSATQMTTTYNCSSDLPGKTAITLVPQCFQQSATVTTSEIEISLTPASKATAYNIYRNGVYYHTLFSTNDSFYDNTVIPGLVYTYFVLTGNGSGETSSDTLRATAPNCSGQPLPDAPALTVTASCDSATSLIALGWTAANNATTYDIYRNDSLYFSNVSGTAFSSRDITPGQAYSYYVIARNAAGSTASNTAGATAGTCKPPPPTIISFSPKTAVTSTQVTINGTGFDQTTAVSFGGTPATHVTLNSIGSVTATVGTGFSGNVEVSTANGSASLAGFNYIFTVPDSNFTVKVTDASCIGSNNGSVQLKAALLYPYRATLSGNGVNQPQDFDTVASWNNLSPGKYGLCISIVNGPQFLQCDSIVINEPKDLSLYSLVTSNTDSVELTFSGASNYHIQLNGKTYNTASSYITLPLNAGDNDIVLSSDKACQAPVEKHILVTGRMVPYPNPFDQSVKINLGNETVRQVEVVITDISTGKQVLKKEYGKQAGILEVDLRTLSSGIYSLHLKTDNVVKVFKIIKNEQ